MKKNEISGLAIPMIVCAFFLLALPPALHAATYYVNAASGNDTASGLSETLAWKTTSKINASGFLPGDQILFLRGQSWNGGLVPRSSGTAASPIVFGAYGAGNKPVIGIGAQTSIEIYNKSYLTLDSLDLRASDRCVNVISDTAGTKSGITVRNCTLVSAAHGVYINALSGNYDTVSITNNSITPGKTALWQVGINFVKGVSNFIISGNTIAPAGEDAIMIDNNCAYGIISGNAGGGNAENTIDVKNSHDILISGNTCSNDGEANIVVHETDSNHIDPSYNIIVEKNRCVTGGQGDRMAQGYRIYAGIYVNYTKTSVIRYNWVEQAFGAGIFMEDMESKANNNQIYGNVILNCGTGTGASPQGGIELGDSFGTKVYNNTVYNQQGTGGHGIYIFGGPNTAGIEVKNNIVHTAGGDLIRVLSAARTNFVSDYNRFYPDGSQQFYWSSAYAGNFDDWKSKSLQDIHSLATDPLLKNIPAQDFSLTKGSSCIDQGAGVGLSKDFKDISIPQGTGPDIGAMEFSEISALLPPGDLKLKPK